MQVCFDLCRGKQLLLWQGKKIYLSFRISGPNAEIYVCSEVLAWVYFQGVSPKIRAKPPSPWENYKTNEEKALN